jgi:DNA-binding NarL/FixJ family response regulator
MSAAALKVLLVDDHAVVRQGLRAYLELQAGIEVCAEAAGAREAGEEASRTRPDVAIVDLVMPDEDGIQATRRICRASPHTRVLLLTSRLGSADVQPAFEAGAAGYQLKEIGGSELLDSLQRVARGERVLHPRLRGAEQAQAADAGAARVGAPQSSAGPTASAKSCCCSPRACPTPTSPNACRSATPRSRHTSATCWANWACPIARRRRCGRGGMGW